jgi:hypothetical protein
MGYELWTSPITGYRRRGTRLAELRRVLGSGIAAHTILEPLKSCPGDASAKEMARVLEQRDFDFAGVQSEQDGPVVGFVARNSLSLTHGLVKDHIRPITTELLISDSTPLPSVLAFLQQRQHGFVLVGLEVGGIVTRADLNKPGVRVYLFGVISLLEMHLTFWIRDIYRQDSWRQQLRSQRIEAAERLLLERKVRNHQTDLLDCVQFCDKRDLIIASEAICRTLQLRSKKYAEKQLKGAEDLRNLLAHGQQDLAQGSSWPEMIQLVGWIDAVVDRSDREVEARAVESAASTRT